jgi:hypothetical protein
MPAKAAKAPIATSSAKRMKAAELNPPDNTMNRIKELAGSAHTMPMVLNEKRLPTKKPLKPMPGFNNEAQRLLMLPFC